MNNLETKALEAFVGTSPLLYRRYVDDTFLGFNNRNDMSVFFNWINTQHPNIKFTKEEESNNELCFWMCLYAVNVMVISLPMCTENQLSQVYICVGTVFYLLLTRKVW